MNKKRTAICNCVKKYAYLHWFNFSDRLSQQQRQVVIHVLTQRFGFLQKECAEFLNIAESTVCYDSMKAGVKYEESNFFRKQVQDLYNNITYYTKYTK